MTEWKINCPCCDGLIGIRYDSESKTTIIRALDDAPPAAPAAPVPDPAGKSDEGILADIFNEGKADAGAKKES